jgi:hypothetical protein
MHDLCHICALQSVSGEGMTPNGYQQHLKAITADLSDIELSLVIQRLQTKAMTPEERKLLKFTRCNLQRLPNWREWDAAFNAQLDAHLEAGAITPPVPRPAPIDGEKPNLLCIQWSNVVKADGT